MWHGFYCHNQPQSEVYGIGFVRLFRDVFAYSMVISPWAMENSTVYIRWCMDYHMAMDQYLWMPSLVRRPICHPKCWCEQKGYRVLTDPHIWMITVYNYDCWWFLAIYIFHIYIYTIYIHIFAIYIYMYMHFPLGRTFTQSLVGGLSLVALGLV